MLTKIKTKLAVVLFIVSIFFTSCSTDASQQVLNIPETIPETPVEEYSMTIRLPIAYSTVPIELEYQILEVRISDVFEDFWGNERVPAEGFNFLEIDLVIENRSNQLLWKSNSPTVNYSVVGQTTSGEYEYAGYVFGNYPPYVIPPGFRAKVTIAFEVAKIAENFKFTVSTYDLAETILLPPVGEIADIEIPLNKDVVNYVVETNETFEWFQNSNVKIVDVVKTTDNIAVSFEVNNVTGYSILAACRRSPSC